MIHPEINIAIVLAKVLVLDVAILAVTALALIVLIGTKTTYAVRHIKFLLVCVGLFVAFDFALEVVSLYLRFGRIF